MIFISEISASRPYEYRMFRCRKTKAPKAPSEFMTGLNIQVPIKREHTWLSKGVSKAREIIMRAFEHYTSLTAKLSPPRSFVSFDEGSFFRGSPRLKRAFKSSL